MCWTVAGKARVRGIGYSNSTRFLRASDLPRKTTAHIALDIKPGPMGDGPSRKITRVVGYTGQWLTVLDMSILIASADLETSLETHWDSDKCVNGH